MNSQMFFFQGCSEVPVTFYESLTNTNLDSMDLYEASWLGVARIPANEATHRDEPKDVYNHPGGHC